MPKILKYYKHFVPIKVRFSDLDVVGHLTNARYQNFLEEARIAYFQDVVGFPKSGLNFNMVLSKISIDFMRSIEFGDDIFVYTRLFNITASSHEVHQLFVRKENERAEIVASAQTLIAAFDYLTKRPTVFPEEYRERVMAYEEAGETALSSPC